MDVPNAASSPILLRRHRRDALSVVTPSLIVVLFLLLAVHRQVTAQSMADPPFALRISCGSPRNVLIPNTNVMWSKDENFSGGSAANISLRSGYAPELSTLRYFKLSDGPENCYNVSLPNGHYVIRLYFAFGQVDNSNEEPIFDVSLEGTLVHSLKQGWSLNPALSYVEARIFITDEAATACFHSTGHGNPAVLSVETLQILDDAYGTKRNYTILKTVKRISCGSKESNYGVEINANVWGGDRYWATDKILEKTISFSINTVNSIQGASEPPNLVPEAVYQSASSTSVGSDLSYVFEVEPNQNYSIWFYFAEIELGITKKGQRVFDISVNGYPVFNEFDIVGQAGGPFTAVVLNSSVAVDGRFLYLDLKARQGGILINGFEIFQVITTEYTTFNQEVWALQALKRSLGLPSRLGWNGDPCVPQEHPWNGVNCQFNHDGGGWSIHGLDLDNQGVKGFLSDDVSVLGRLESLNLSSNNIYDGIPSNIGNLMDLQILDLSYNKLNGSIPGTLGRLTRLRKLFLNGNLLSGQVPAVLGAGPITGESFNFSGNPGLCGIPSLPACHDEGLSKGSVAGVLISVIVLVLVSAVCAVVIYKRRKNIARAQQLSTARDAPYAKSRIALGRDVQMSKPVREPYVPHYMQQS